jgi:hypothetical protein
MRLPPTRSPIEAWNDATTPPRPFAASSAGYPPHTSLAETVAGQRYAAIERGSTMHEVVVETW